MNAESSRSDISDNHRFRIFIASPKDVNHERQLVLEAIAHICCKQQFRDRINIELVGWDQLGSRRAFESQENPQKTISHCLKKPEECDLVIVIFWSRMGTPIPNEFELKEDGAPYESGTEWEYLNAVKGYKTNKKPSNIWIYRRRGVPNPSFDDPDYQNIVEQWQKVEKFFSNFENKDKALIGGINYYEGPNDFRLLFEDHLTNRLKTLLEESTSEESNNKDINDKKFVTWNKSPYPGLKSFTPEQAPIYFGRGHEIDQMLKQFSEKNVRLVSVVGASGTGKSSLVNAGLLPELRTGAINNQPWNDVVFKPGERGGNPFLALAFSIKSKIETSHSETKIAANLQTDLVETQKYLSQLLSKQALIKLLQIRNNGNSEHIDSALINTTTIEEIIQKTLPKDKPDRLLIVIDQFEEIFTQSYSFKSDFVLFIESLLKIEHIRIATTIRADFYARAIEDPIFSKILRQESRTFPLDPPSSAALQQMIVRPAEAAGIELENGLVELLLDDAGTGQGALALIAFTLNQLYQREHQNNSRYISINAYRRLGGAKGIVQKQAEAAIKEQNFNYAILPNLFSNLVEVNELEIATRRRALQSHFNEDLKKVTEALVSARLLVASENENNEPVIEVAHEIVLTGWDRLRQWIRNHAGALRARRDLEQAASEWDKIGRKNSALRSGFMLARYLTSAEPRSQIANDYLKKAIQKKNIFNLLKCCLVLLLILSLYVFSAIKNSSYPPRLATKAYFVQRHLLPLNPPEMAIIQAGEFHMGNAWGEGQVDEYFQHKVVIKAFEMGKSEVTFEEYDLFAAATGREKPSDDRWGREMRPVINIYWDDAVAYTQWLSDHTGLRYRLPSESEWEYAARANTTTPRYWPETDGDTKDACTFANVYDVKNKPEIKGRYLNAVDNSFNCADPFPFTAPVKQFKPNAWNLYDMLGNVHEWTQDCYTDSYEDTPTDGSAYFAKECKERVVRGGAWGDPPIAVRSAFRGQSPNGNSSNDIGFRLVREIN